MHEDVNKFDYISDKSMKIINHQNQIKNKDNPNFEKKSTLGSNQMNRGNNRHHHQSNNSIISSNSTIRFDLR